MGKFTTKQWGYILLLTSVAVNSWAWYQLGLKELIIPWIPLEIFVYYAAMNRVMFLSKASVFFLSAFLTFISLQQYITSADVAMKNDTLSTDGSKVAMSITKARLAVVKKKQGYESIDPVYLRQKEKMTIALNRLQNQPVKYKGKIQPDGLWIASGQCGVATKKQRNITNRFSVSCRKIRATRDALITLRQTYNSESRRQEELRVLAASYASSSQSSQEDTKKNIKKLAMNTVIMLAPILMVENVDEKADKIADTALVLLAFLVAVVLSGTVFAVGIDPEKKIKSASKMGEIAQKTGGGIREIVETVTNSYPFATVRKSNVLSKVSIPEIKGVKVAPDSAYASHLAKTLRSFSDGNVVTRNAIKANCKCGSNVATAVFKTLQHNNLVTEDSKWQLPAEDDATS